MILGLVLSGNQIPISVSPMLLKSDPKTFFILFDTEEELDVAIMVGMDRMWLVRDEKSNSRVSHLQAPDFNSIRV